MSGQWQDLGALTGRALGGIVRVTADTHQAISDRVDTALPPGAKVFNRAHAATASAIYDVVEKAHVRTPQALARIGAASGYEPDLDRVLSIANGFHGDLIEADHPSLAVAMSARAQADPTAHIVVFVHGLAEDDNAWSLGGGPSYGERLIADGFAPVFIQYNTGRHISDNGQALSELLDDLVGNWPVPVESISLVGHSMGGLVVRSACHTDLPWTDRVRCVVSLGSPHKGAPLEKTVHVVDWVMRRVPEAEPIGRILASRSAGVKDLRFGSLVEADWRDRDVDAFLDNQCAEVPFLPHATYYWIASAVTDDPEHPIGRMVGDGMVRYPSASAVRGEGLRLGGVNHLRLLNDERAFEALRAWLTGSVSGSATRST